MGAGTSKQEFPQSKNYSILDYGYCKVWKRVDTQRETMEQYEIAIESERMLEAYKRMWLLRASEEAVVGVYYFTHRAHKELCGFYQQGAILTERVPYRLSQFSNIPYQQILYILKICLSSYKLLNAEYGLFLVRSTMIGINMQKQIKVWHHTDLSAAEPQNANCKNLSEMVESILESVEINAEAPRYYPRFSDFLRANRMKIGPGFEEVLKALSTYIKINRIPKCENMPKLSNYLRQAEGWEELTYNSNFLSNLSNISQLNKSTYGKYSFRGNSDNSLSSSKTLKNSPKPNIYTHKEIEHHGSSRERSGVKSPRSQIVQIQPQTERYRYVGKQLDWGRASPKPRENPFPIRNHSIEGEHFNHIQIKIPNMRPNNSPPPNNNFKSSNIASIDRRIHQSPQQASSIYYATPHNEANFQTTQPFRTNRFHQQNVVPYYMDQRSQSRSPSSSEIYFHRK